MKKFCVNLLVSLAFATTLDVSGQHWQYVNPKPTNNPLQAMTFADASTGFACGLNGTIVKTTDGGATWTSKYSGTPYHLFAISFANSMTGLAVGMNGAILKTTDGGETWLEKSSGGLASIFTGVSFPVADTAYVSSYYDNGLLRSTDAGESWSVIALPTNPIELKFVSGKKGYFISGGTLVRTLDAGVTWNDLFYFPGNVYSLTYVDPLQAYACGDNSLIYKTDNGGAYWSTVYIGQSGQNFNCIFFPDPDHGYSLGEYLFGLKTTNGGANWDTITPGFYLANRLWMNSYTTGLFFKTDNGYGPPWLSRTTDGFSTSHNLITGHFNNVKAITSPSPSTCYAVGDSGVFMKSLDFGQTWNQYLIGTSVFYPLNAMSFINQDIGWVAGYHGTIAKTVNGGQTWFEQSSGTTFSLNAICFYDDLHGCAVGEAGICLKTNDGGLHWNTLNLGTNLNLNCINFVNSSVGYIAGNAGNILKSVDGGLTWSHMNSGITTDMKSLYFINENIGFTCGNGIYKTVDGGQSWNRVYDFYYYFNSIFFRDAMTGYACGAAGTIFMTVDGGETWLQQISGTGVDLSAIFINSSNYAYAAGLFGTIIRTMDNNVGIPQTTQNDNPQLIVYPNPAHNMVTIKLPVDDKEALGLKIFDMRGRNVREIVLKGTGSVDISGIQPGIYIIEAKRKNIIYRSRLLVM